MKFKRSTTGGGRKLIKDTLPSTFTKASLKTIDKKAAQNKTKGLNFKLFELEGKENQRLASGANHKRHGGGAESIPTTADALSERMAQGLHLWTGGGSKANADFKEAKPIAKPVLSFMDGSQNYFKRSFSMRARSTQTHATTSEVEIKTATIRRAFGKSLTSKKFCTNRSRRWIFRWNSVCDCQQGMTFFYEFSTLYGNADE